MPTKPVPPTSSRSTTDEPRARPTSSGAPGRQDHSRSRPGAAAKRRMNDAVDSTVDRSATRRQRFEARRVRRLIRHIDPWSVLKASLIMFTCIWLICMVAGLMLWNVAVSSGTVEQIEGFMNTNLSLDDWAFNGSALFRQYGMVGIFLTLLCTGAAVVGTIIFNLISDIIGGVWITVIEEETARPVEADRTEW